VKLPLKVPLGAMFGIVALRVLNSAIASVSVDVVGCDRLAMFQIEGYVGNWMTRRDSQYVITENVGISIR
jgi:hypothetical protein